ncbi:hypothetical protein OKW21_000715 [Catalinimonas alkaloidigena]|uniref:hypothetical protein n=1 Tax=Catalinimonas alkaloidigena TaxID=1075417 RepID=UPI0024070493|nr:hypothetical protein [Catalinimonas alkaloidigena]MDF9795452.1 hypothetical protein [Catalinimonas alkaloidigena]
MIKLVLLLLLGVLGVGISLSQPTVYISGSKDSLGILAQVSQHLKHLDVDENVFIHIGFYNKMPENMKAVTYVQKTFPNNGYPNDQLIEVRIDAHLNKKRQKLALAHEMIHVKQYVKGELEVVNRHHIIWKGTQYSYLHNKDRLLAPWEQEAYRHDRELVNIFDEGYPIQSPTLASQNNP